MKKHEKVVADVNLTLPRHHGEGNVIWFDITVRVILLKMMLSEGNTAD